MKTIETETEGIIPASIEFYAVIDGKRIEDGDHWLPTDINGMSQRCGPNDCHPVTISSAGVHYCKKLRDGSYLTNENGKTYYYDWEHTEICDSGRLYLTKPTS